MIRSLVPSLVLVLGLASCGPKKETEVPQGGNKGELTPTVDANPNPVGPECIAKCLEGDQFKDQAVEDREKSCAATCPEAEVPPADDAGADAGAEPAAAEG
jgi:hypothetical protein